MRQRGGEMTKEDFMGVVVGEVGYSEELAGFLWIQRPEGFDVEDDGIPVEVMRELVKMVATEYKPVLEMLLKMKKIEEGYGGE